MTGTRAMRARMTGGADVVRDAHTSLLVYAPWRRRRRGSISRWAGRFLVRRETRTPHPAPAT